MLHRLHVRNFVLIDSLDIEFPEGLIIITGQTGAGKSIILGALSLIMGAKADSGMLSEGADSCVVEAEFTIPIRDGILRAVLEENEIECDSGELILRRVVNRSGRSRAFINDCPVSVSLMQTVSSRLIDIHSQHQTLRLSDQSFRLDILDYYSGNGELRQSCSQAWRVVTGLQSEIDRIQRQISEAERDKDYNQAQFERLDAAGLRIGEFQELEEEQRQLANAEEIKSSLCQVESLYDSSSSADGFSLDSALREASRLLSKTSRYVPAAVTLSERMDSCRLEIEDILSEVSSINSGIVLSQSRLEQVEERMSLLMGLMHKYSCSDEQQLIAVRDSLGESISDSGLLEEKLLVLQRELSQAKAKYDELSAQLHRRRVEASDSFALGIEESIRSLELPYAVFKVAMSVSQPTPSGFDTVDFLFSANANIPTDISKCASGGELSRIMLSLKEMMAKFTEMPTLIFDEIDTGVSGSVADKIGSMICSMGENMQVFAITHLPQVAAKGKAHYLVSKDIDPKQNKATSTIIRLSEHERVMELARMLSGSVLTEAAVENAKSLLNG